MHPADLLSLTCTCKSLHYVLTGESASSVWRAARLQVEGLPDCPTNLSEQQYAGLLFNNNCHARIFDSPFVVAWSTKYDAGVREPGGKGLLEDPPKVLFGLQRRTVCFDPQDFS